MSTQSRMKTLAYPWMSRKASVRSFRLTEGQSDLTYLWKVIINQKISSPEIGTILTDKHAISANRRNLRHGWPAAGARSLLRGKSTTSRKTAVFGRPAAGARSGAAVGAVAGWQRERATHTVASCKTACRLHCSCCSMWPSGGLPEGTSGSRKGTGAFRPSAFRDIQAGRCVHMAGGARRTSSVRGQRA